MNTTDYGPPERRPYRPHNKTRVYKKKRRCFPWKATYIGRVGLCQLYINVTDLNGDEALRMGPSGGQLQFGRELVPVDYQEVLAKLSLQLPELPLFFLQKTGKPLTPEILKDRVMNMYRQNKKRGEGSIADKNIFGSEHPAVNPKLTLVLDKLKFLWGRSQKNHKYLHNVNLTELVQSCDAAAKASKKPSGTAE